MTILLSIAAGLVAVAGCMINYRRGYKAGSIASEKHDDGTCISFGVDVDKADVYISPPADIIVDPDPPGWPVDYTRPKIKPS